MSGGDDGRQDSKPSYGLRIFFTLEAGNDFINVIFYFIVLLTEADVIQEFSQFYVKVGLNSKQIEISTYSPSITVVLR